MRDLALIVPPPLARTAHYISGSVAYCEELSAIFSGGADTVCTEVWSAGCFDWSV